MKNTLKTKLDTFKVFNELSLKGEIVIFGSDYMANFPFYDLINRTSLESAVYNRSIENMTLKDAEEALKTCVLDLCPDKIFLQLGEHEYMHDGAEETYVAIIDAIKLRLPKAKIYIVSLPFKAAERFNRRLATIADRKHIYYISLTNFDEGSYKKQFNQLSCFFRSNRIDMVEAFALSSI